MRKNSTLLQLVSDNPKPVKPACTTCKHYHPDLLQGATRTVSWHPSWPFRRVAVEPSANAHYHAACSFFGGHAAAMARDTCAGQNWEDRHA